MTPPQGPASAPRPRVWLALGVSMLVFISYGVPVVGLIVSLGIPLVTHVFRTCLWPEASRGSSLLWSVLAWAGLWLPGLVGIFASASGESGVGVSTSWLVIPLCAPTGMDAVLLPALAAALTCLAGLLGAAVTRHAAWWVLAAWLAPWVHHLVLSLVPHEFFC